MKKHVANIILLILLVAVVGLIYLRHKERSKHIPEVLLGKPFKDVIELKSKIAGKLVAEQEIEIKSSISGIVEELFFEVGDTVSTGSPIARIKPAPEPEELENARKHLKTAEIQHEMEKTNYKRKLGLESKGGISKSEMEQAKYSLEIKELELKAAQKKLRLLLEGYLEQDQEKSNLIKSTAHGVITELPVKQGQSITKRNTHNDGTTIAQVANMGKLLFKGQLSEYEINKLKKGMPLKLIIGAYDDLVCQGHVVRIAPQALKGQQAVQFDFEATVDFPFDSLEVKTGLTVVAEFITQQTDSVLCVEEKYLSYSGDSIFAEVLNERKVYEKVLVSTGASDGTTTEIIEGLKPGDKLKPVDWN